MNNIKEAMQYFKTDCQDCEKAYNNTCSGSTSRICNYNKLAYLALSKVWRGKHNPPLTKEELDNRVGKPVFIWAKLNKGWHTELNSSWALVTQSRFSNELEIVLPNGSKVDIQYLLNYGYDFYDSSFGEK